MPRKTTCPSCRTTFAITGDAAGEGTCPHCGTPVHLPEAPEPTAIREGVPPGRGLSVASCPHCGRAIPEACLFCPHCERLLVHVPGPGEDREDATQLLIFVLLVLGVVHTALGLLVGFRSLADGGSPVTRLGGELVIGIVVLTWLFAFRIALGERDRDAPGSAGRFAVRLAPSPVWLLLLAWMTLFTFLFALCAVMR